MSVQKMIENTPHPIRCIPLAENVLRVTHLKPGLQDFPPDRPWINDILLTQKPYPGELTLQANFSKEKLSIIDKDGKIILREAAPIKWQEEGKTILRLQSEDFESFYGWGEWFNGFQRQDGKLELKNRESISYTQGRQTYSTIPFFLSSRGYGFFLLNSHTTRWEIQQEKNEIRIELPGDTVDYLLIYGPQYKQILSTYTAFSGRPPLPPRWAFGLWVTSYPQDHQNTVIEHVEKHREHNIPLDAMILDYHWEERFHNFRWREELIPDPDAMIREMRKLGIRLGLIFTPFLNNQNQFLKKIFLQLAVHDIPKGMIFEDERALPEYAEAKEKGYLAHPAASWWFGKGGIFDFSNPEAAQWWQNKMDALYQQGIEFFKNDDGEYLPENAQSWLGMDGEEYHNLYGFYYGKAIYEGMQQLDDRRGLIYARSVWAGSQRYPGIFMGDQKPTFECLRRTLRSGLNLSLLGFAYWTADVFGLDGKTTLETHIRYAQWALMNPIARYFWRPPEVDDTRFPWSHTEKAEENFRTYTDLRYRLLPYWYSLAWQSWQSGLPILRPMLLEYQNDARFAGVYDQALIGENLLCAPVHQSGAEFRHIVLPEGIWHDFHSQESWMGPDEIICPAPLEHLPLLVKGGTILPLGPVLQHIPDEHQFGQLELHCWPPYPAVAWIYDDDGKTRAYQQGDFSRSKITLHEIDQDLLLEIHPAQGETQTQISERQIKIILHAAEMPKGVRINEENNDTWNYDAEIRQLMIEIPQPCPLKSKTSVLIQS